MDSLEPITHRHHRVSRPIDFSGRRRNFDIDAFSSSSHTSAASPSFPSKSDELSPSPSTQPAPSPDAPNPSQGAAAQMLLFLKANIQLQVEFSEDNRFTFRSLLTDAKPVGHTLIFFPLPLLVYLFACLLVCLERTNQCDIMCINLSCM